MFKFILMIALMIFLIAMLGSVILEQFPSLVPLWVTKQLQRIY